MFLWGILVFVAALSGIAQKTSVIQFVDADGKTLTEAPGHHQGGQVYLPVDVVKTVIDPGAIHQYNHPRKRLLLKIKDKRIRLQIGKPGVNIDPGNQTVTLSTPPVLITQQPMLPIDFFKQFLPLLTDVEVIYNSTLNRLQIRPKRSWVFSASVDTQEWAIIVDPGHGGPVDRGCESGTGLLEKDIVLTLAKRIQEASEQQGLKIYLTREADRAKTHLERVQVAKRNQGQLFLSLHCNASFSPHEKGIRIYLNNPEGQLRLPGSSRSALTGQQLKVLAQPNFLKQSQNVASALQTELNFLAEIPVKIINLPLITLSDAYMPGVVLELGYLSNAEDLKKLSEPEYLTNVAQAITRALQRYISSIHPQNPQ